VVAVSLKKRQLASHWRVRTHGNVEIPQHPTATELNRPRVPIVESLEHRLPGTAEPVVPGAVQVQLARTLTIDPVTVPIDQTGFFAEFVSDVEMIGVGTVPRHRQYLWNSLVDPILVDLRSCVTAVVGQTAGVPIGADPPEEGPVVVHQPVVVGLAVVIVATTVAKVEVVSELVDEGGRQVLLLVQPHPSRDLAGGDDEIRLRDPARHAAVAPVKSVDDRRVVEGTASVGGYEPGVLEFVEPLPERDVILVRNLTGAAGRPPGFAVGVDRVRAVVDVQRDPMRSEGLDRVCLPPFRWLAARHVVQVDEDVLAAGVSAQRRQVLVVATLS